MTIGAAGVKLYRNLPDAQIVNATATLNWQILRWLRWENTARYSYGRENTGARLPLIAPFSYQAKCKVLWGNVEAEVGTEVVARHSGFSEKYGETLTPGYKIWHINAGWRFNLGKVRCNLHAGIDNLFNKYYSTYSDWNHIPQKGRSIYTNLTLQL